MALHAHVSAVPHPDRPADPLARRSFVSPPFARPCRWLRRSSLAAVTLACLAVSAAAQVVSHGFEDGTTQGWVPRGSVTVASSTDVARTGTHSLKTTGRTANWNGPALDLRSRLTANTTYQISGWVRLTAGQSPSNLKFTIERRPTGGSTSYEQVNAAVAASDSGWVQLQGNYSFTSTANDTLTLYLESDDPAAEYYLDDFTITALSAPGCPEPHDQSGIETGFETGTLQGWSPRGSAQLVPTTEASATGNYSLRVTGRTASWQGPAINALCKMHKGSKYLISVRVRLLPGEVATQVRLSMERRFNGVTNYTTIIGNTAVTDGAWVELTTEYTFGFDVEQMQLYVETASGNASFYIDDFLLMHLPPVPIQTDIPSVHEELAAYFPVGAAVEPNELVGSHAELLLKHFNLLVAGNAMKWSSLQPTEGNFNFGPADALANFARANGLRMRGHTLVWHNQTPAWVFQDADGNPLQPGNAAHRQLLLDRLETHIHTVVARYADIVDSWDVVNEAIDVSQPNGLRNSPWYQIIGPEYIDWAFEFASEVAGSSQLLINDYNTHEPAKRDRLRDVVQGLLDRGIRVDGVGHQTHIRIGWPSLELIAESLDVFTAMGLLNEITELDVSVYSNDTDTAPVTEEQLVAQGYRYRDLFDLFREKSDQINSVTLWGLADDNTWLKTFPIARDDQPLLFDEDLQAKYAYWGVVDPFELPVVPKELKVSRAANALQIAAALNSHWDFIAPTPLSTGDRTASWGWFKLSWRGDTLYVVVDVDDASRQKTDTVEVFVGGETYTFAGLGLRRDGGATGLIVPVRGGYRLIAGVPIGSTPSVGDDLRFDLRVTDAATGAQLSWSDTHHQQDVDDDAFGTLHLLPEKQIATVRRGTPTIDGNEDRVWRNVREFTTHRFVLGTSGATAEVKLLWDEGHLYVYATVSDPVLSKASPNPWEEDSVELFVDANNAQGTSYDGDDAQYRINFDNEVSVGGTSAASNVTSATRQIAGGYVVEAAIALDADVTERGAVLGFDVQVNDDGAGDGVRSSVATWNDTSGQAYQDPSNFGALLLK